MSKIIAGIDEAGRGPVLGPLVMVALAIKEEDQKKLEWLGVKDSKLLSRQAREELFEKIREVVYDFRIEVIEPDAIDLSLNSDESNLNWLEADTSARLVSEINPHKIIVDCPSINLVAYKKYFLGKLSNKDVELLVEHKADFNHIIVAAASVIAKVIRDRIVDRLHEEVGVDFGSGYLTDAKTQDFLQNYHEEYPHLFRKSWKSYKNVVDAKKQMRLGDF
ncbi:ribonuclease HII [Candidatus Woesearchaeota archaeon CG10_big_fil_rev_8_21_14_0_10_32_24]|nr:MAG: ribonuclease HII [Candidatus Woesearchaeota archaeon CG10_big_fil_rev_8_21_14_0_10_32_24]